MNEFEAAQSAFLAQPPVPELPDSSRSERPWAFGLIIAPVAVLANGVIAGALSLLLRKQGVSSARQGEIVSLLTLPQTIYFLWSPITDFWIRRRNWLILGALAAAVVILIAFHRPHLDSRSAIALMFLSACLCQLVVSSAGGMLGALHSEETRRRASGFYQSGSLAFGALAIFVLASLAGRYSLGTLGWISAALVAIPALFAFTAPRQPFIQTQGFEEALSRIGAEFKSTFLNWRAVPYTLMMLFPMCSGAAIGLLPGLATDYGVTDQQVAWMNGIAGALLTASGAMAATLVPTRIRASVAYLTSGLINALPLAFLALGPLRPSTYFIGATLYLFTIGACYALFTAVVLEFLGHSGKSGSGRYSIINSLGNIPVAYMALVDGKGAAHFGPRGLPGAEAVVGAMGATILLIFFLTHQKNHGTTNQGINQM
jgi:PAT family beta-lactamase induction signal transducer AmpG